MADVTMNGTPTYSRNYDKDHVRQEVIVVKAQHNFEANAVAANNTVNYFQIPANSVILGVNVNVDSKQDNTDIKVGTGGDDDTFSTATDTATNGASIRPTTIGKAQGQPVYVNAATNIMVTAITNEINAALISLVCTYVRVDALSTT